VIKAQTRRPARKRRMEKRIFAVAAFFLKMKVMRSALPTWLLLLLPLLLPMTPAAGEAPLPPGPLIARMPPQSAWSILYQYPTPVEGRPPSRFARYRPRERQIARDGTLYHEKTVYESGADEERWLAGALEVARVPGSREVVVVEFGEAPPPDHDRFETSDFPGLGWVTPETYRGTRSYEGRRVWVFCRSAAGAEGDIPPFPLELGKRRPELALIDPETRHPLYSSDGQRACFYRYSQAAEPLRPPEPFLRVLRKLGYKG